MVSALRMTDTDELKVGPGEEHKEGKWDATIDLSSNLKSVSDGDDPALFYPFTITLVGMKMNREPMPLDSTQANQMTWFLDELK